MKKNKVVAARMNIEDLAKARDGLLSKGLEPSQLSTVSQIIKLTFYYGILSICDDPLVPASEESINLITQKFNKTKIAKTIKLNELL